MSRAATGASSAKLACRPLASCKTWLRLARHAAGATPQRVAAAWISISLAAAPATRIPHWPVKRTLLLPPVSCRFFMFAAL